MTKSAKPLIDGVHASEIDQERIAAAVREILFAIGEDPDRDGLLETPNRVARMYAEICAGLHQEPSEHLATMFEADHDEMVMVRDIPMYSLCEHHLIPFIGKAHVAYIPNRSGNVIGLSKVARLVDGFAKRPQVQERLTRQVAEALKAILDTEDVAVVMDAKHMCVSSRGIEDEGSSTITADYHGAFRQEAVRREFLDHIRG